MIYPRAGFRMTHGVWISASQAHVTKRAHLHTRAAENVPCYANWLFIMRCIIWQSLLNITFIGRMLLAASPTPVITPAHSGCTTSFSIIVGNAYWRDCMGTSWRVHICILCLGGLNTLPINLLTNLIGCPLRRGCRGAHERANSLRNCPPFPSAGELSSLPTRTPSISFSISFSLVPIIPPTSSITTS